MVRSKRCPNTWGKYGTSRRKLTDDTFQYAPILNIAVCFAIFHEIFKSFISQK